MQMINALDIKIALLKYFRFKRQYPLVVTEIEFNGFIADILALKKIAIEVEIKMTRSDFLKELQDKKYKHKIYNGYYPSEFHIIPNKFYFAFPSGFPIDSIKSLIPERYGILEVNSVKKKEGLYVNYYNKGLYINSCRIKKPARFLTHKINKQFWENAIKRLTSENIGLREKIREIQGNSK